jgi:hypothetical protein
MSTALRSRLPLGLLGLVAASPLGCFHSLGDDDVSSSSGGDDDDDDDATMTDATMTGATMTDATMTDATMTDATMTTNPDDTADSDGSSTSNEDCEGVPGGSAVEDMCGTCDDDPSNDCVQDCAGDWGGEAVEDMCGTCDADPLNDCVLDHDVDSGWDCQSGESCQDVYEFDLPAGAQVTVTVSNVTGASVPLLAVYTPGTALSGTNTLTNVANDRMCVGQDESDSVVFTTAVAGVHSFAVGRDWGASAGAAGTYSFQIASDIGLVPGAQTVDDQDSLAAGTQCLWTAVVDSGWDCGSGENCQDVYDIDLPAGVNLTIAATNITGASVARAAVFEPGVGLDGTNLLTGASADYGCGPQNADLVTPPVAIASAGTHQVAIGRDWGYSAGSAGTYTLSIGVDAVLSTTPAQTVDDVNAEAPNCP